MSSCVYFASIHLHLLQMLYFESLGWININACLSSYKLGLHGEIKSMKTYNLRDCNWTRTRNHLVLKRTLNHLAKLAKRLS